MCKSREGRERKIETIYTKSRQYVLSTSLRSDKLSPGFPPPTVVQYKVSLLQLLMEAAYSTNLVRVEAFQNAEDTHRLLMTRQEKLWVGTISFVEVCPQLKHI